MLLVLSHSEDTTTDVVLDYLDDLEVFRFNLDLWKQYEWNVNETTFRLSDPLGRVCEESQTHAVYLRKLFFNPPFIDVPAGGSEEYWLRGEVEMVWTGIRDLASESGKLALIHPSTRGRWNKMRQMRVAAKFFRVPEWCAYHAPTCPLESPVVVKAFGQNHIGNGGMMTVREVDPGRLSSSYPWFVQRKISEATHDVTVAWVDGQIFAYQLPRDRFQGDDCRLPTSLDGLIWEPCQLSADEERAVQRFMAETGFSFGRLDFLKDADGLWFLEVNPNGQFAWLDPVGEHGLLKAVAAAIRRCWLNSAKRGGRCA